MQATFWEVMRFLSAVGVIILVLINGIIFLNRMVMKYERDRLHNLSESVGNSGGSDDERRRAEVDESDPE